MVGFAVRTEDSHILFWGSHRVFRGSSSKLGGLRRWSIREMIAFALLSKWGGNCGEEKNRYEIVDVASFFDAFIYFAANDGHSF